uniref:Uncharacterized protein n=1 Tax=Amphimedon queenslandica TaxID=400682 RepID=A0A1X7T3U8_AMPQE
MSLLQENDSTTIGDVDTIPSFSIQDTSLINARKNLTTAVTIVKTVVKNVNRSGHNIKPFNNKAIDSCFE